MKVKLMQRKKFRLKLKDFLILFVLSTTIKDKNPYLNRHTCHHNYYLKYVRVQRHPFIVTLWPAWNTTFTSNRQLLKRFVNIDRKSFSVSTGLCYSFLLFVERYAEVKSSAWLFEHQRYSQAQHIWNYWLCWNLYPFAFWHISYFISSRVYLSY